MCKRITPGTIEPKAESGQAIILIAVLMVALLGIAGLAIDGGGLYFLHRDTQNASDATILAATMALCTTVIEDDAELTYDPEDFCGNRAYDPETGVVDPDEYKRCVIQTAGFTAASENGFGHNEFTDSGADTTTIENWVTVEWPPSAGAAAGDEDYVRVSVMATKPTYFIQFVYAGNPLRATSGGVGQCTPSHNNLLPNAAIVALNTTDCSTSTIRVTGNGNTYTHDAGIFVNSDASESDSENCTATNLSGGGTSGGITVEGNGLQVVATDPQCLDENGHNSLSGANLSGDVLTCGMAPISATPLEDISPPNGACVGTAIEWAGGATVTPGYYSRIRINSGETVAFEPGLYCIKELDIRGGTISGDGVVFYFPPDGLGLQFNGNPDSISLKAPTGSTCIDASDGTCDWKDLLIWSDASGNGAEIHVNGNSSGDTWWGLIYAPYSECSLEGGGNYTLHGQLICDNVDLNGSGDIDVYYELAKFLQTPPTIGIAD